MEESLRPAIRLQSTIVHALIMQDLNKRYAESRLGALMALIEPLALIFTLYIARFVLQGSHQAAGVPLLLVLVTGLLMAYCFRFVTMSVIGSTSRRTAILAFPQVTTLDPILAQIVTSCCIYGGVMLCAFTAAWFWTNIPPRDPLLIMIASGLVLLTGSGAGLVVGCILRIVPGLALFVRMLLRLELFFSGAFFLATELPSRFLPYVRWNPTFHNIEIMREAWFPGYVSPIADLPYVVAVVIVLAAIGLSLERVTRSRV